MKDKFPHSTSDALTRLKTQSEATGKSAQIRGFSALSLGHNAGLGIGRANLARNSRNQGQSWRVERLRSGPFLPSAFRSTSAKSPA